MLEFHSFSRQTTALNSNRSFKSFFMLVWKLPCITPAGFNSLRQTSRHVTSRHVTPRHATSRHATPRHATSRHVTSRHATPRHATPRHATSRHATSRHATSRHVRSRHATSEDKRQKQTKQKKKKLQFGFIHEKQTQEKGIKGENKMRFYGIVGNKTHFCILNYKKTDNTNIFCSRFSMWIFAAFKTFK